jgi:hypothetical protein
MKVDVIVVGGGSAGVSAAVAAARLGAKVLLLERQGMLGGMASSAHVHSICGLYQLRKSEQDPLLPTNSGFPMEFAQKLLKIGCARGPVRAGQLDILLHQPAGFAYLADLMVQAEAGLEVCLHSELVEIEMDGPKKIGGLRIRSRGKMQNLEAAICIDTTGDAEVALLSGADFECAPTHILQRPAYIFSIGGVDGTMFSDNARLEVARKIAYAVSAQNLPPDALGIAFRQGVMPTEVWGTIDLEAKGFDPCAGEGLTAMESRGRFLAKAVMDFLKDHAEGFSKSYISSFPARAGVRESRRVMGLMELTENDILTGSRFEDEVAFSSWPIELRETTRGPKFRFPQENRSCGIPLRCLQSRNIENLFMAGRCVSATHEAQAALRVIGTGMAMGEAAGKAAAQAVQNSSFSS